MSLVSIKKTSKGTYYVIDGENDTANISTDIIEAIEEVLIRLEPENFDEHTISVRIGSAPNALISDRRRGNEEQWHPVRND